MARFAAGRSWEVSYFLAADLDLLDLEVDADGGWLVCSKLKKWEQGAAQQLQKAWMREVLHACSACSGHASLSHRVVREPQEDA